MNTVYAMQRANGDWFAVDDHGRYRVPVFRSSSEAMVARSRETGMECFRPVLLDEITFKNLTTTDGGKACYWLVEDPLMKLSRGLALDTPELGRVMRNGNATAK